MGFDAQGKDFTKVVSTTGFGEGLALGTAPECRRCRRSCRGIDALIEVLFRIRGPKPGRQIWEFPKSQGHQIWTQNSRIPNMRTQSFGHTAGPLSLPC